jgi:hypothetical protein
MGKGKTVNAEQLHKILAGRKILSVENGNTPGWLVINFEPSEELLQNNPGKSLREFLTVQLLGEGDPHYSSCALHVKEPDGNGIVWMLRDTRTLADLGYGVEEAK